MISLYPWYYFLATIKAWMMRQSLYGGAIFSNRSHYITGSSPKSLSLKSSIASIKRWKIGGTLIAIGTGMSSRFTTVAFSIFSNNVIAQYSQASYERLTIESRPISDVKLDLRILLLMLEKFFYLKKTTDWISATGANVMCLDTFFFLDSSKLFPLSD